VFRRKVPKNTLIPFLASSRFQKWRETLTNHLLRTLMKRQTNRKKEKENKEGGWV
jgi:hypothetical protein